MTVHDWVGIHSALRARFLRRLSDAICGLLLPQLTGQAAEVAAYSDFLAQRMASEDDVHPAIGAGLNAEFDAEAARAIAAISAVADTAKAGELEALLNESRAAGLSSADRSRMLRGILGLAARRLGGEPHAAARTRAAAIAALDHQWSDARNRMLPQKNTDGQIPSSESSELTAERLTDYLASRFPGEPGIRCVRLSMLPGGRSKRTIILEVEGASILPREMVMRQDGSAGIDTSVVDEAHALESAAGHGLPISDVLLCESATSAHGKPFILMNRLPGEQAGSYFGFARPDKEFAIKAARLLARLHAIDPADTPLVRYAQPGAKATILAELALQERKWWAEAVEPSPIMDYGLHWVRNNLHRIPDAAAIVHGDYRPHNFLTEGGELTALLDWEFTHLGDPAEDLAYIRPLIVPFMPWADFMAAYVDAGGRAHEEGTLLFYEVWNMVRLTASGVAGTSRFLEGRTDDLCDGIGGYFILPIHETIISRGIRAAEAAWAQSGADALSATRISLAGVEQ